MVDFFVVKNIPFQHVLRYICLAEPPWYVPLVITYRGLGLVTRSKSCATKKFQRRDFMEQELAYSFHLGSDKNKSKLAKKVAKENVSGTTSLSNNAIQNAKDLSDVNKHNLRDYDNQTKQLDNATININEILDNLKPTKLNKNNMVISNEDVQKIKNYIKNITQDSKKCK